jgi:hypothetical protein
MSFVPVSSAATTAAAAAAQRERLRKLRQEEEQMTGYSGEDLEGWEFKIVRASTRKFKDPDFVRQVCAEEAKAGWEMLEKFDDYRIRFKRRVERRSDDAHLDTDPYRTQVGITGNMLEASVAGAVVVGLGVLALLGFLLFRMAQ